MMADRPCLGCDEINGGPRHQVYKQGMWHFHCHAARGCESCATQLQGVEHLTQDELSEHLRKLREESNG